MTLTLYTTSDNPKKIGKTKTQQVQLTDVIRPQDNGNKRNPVLIVTSSDLTSSTILSCNYAYITEYSRYYFIGSMRPLSNNRIEIPLECDVLESFASGIKNNPVLIERSEIYNSPYITDSARPAYNFPMVLTKSFSSGFDSLHYYLTVASSVEGS